MLVNNAAACFYLSIDETSERRLRVAYEVNAITPYLLTKAVVPPMRERGAGWIVNIASGIADPAPPGPVRATPFARASTYAPSKASLNRLTEALATELGGYGHRGERGRARDGGRDRRRDRGDGAAGPSGSSRSRRWPRPRSRSATCDPVRETGLVVKSLSYLRERNRPIMTLDGRGVLA